MKNVSGIENLERKIGYTFQDKQLLIKALTHRSFANENHDCHCNYERLEFLGDSLLGFAAASHLFHYKPGLKEGEMSKYKAKLVCEDSLYEAAKRLGIGECVFMAKGAELTGGHDNPSILADVMEAITAAIFLESGMKAAIVFLQENVFQYYKISDLQQDDNKSQLQEILAHSGRSPVYRLLSSTGPDHNKSFTYGVYIGEKLFGIGVGSTKKQAQMRAAKEAIERIDREEKKDVSESD